MASEETPLLNDGPLDPHEAVYKRFSPLRKKTIVGLVSWTGLLPLFVSGSFIPSIPQIAHDLNSTGPVINLAVSISIFATAVGGLVCASYSSFYGRRIVYLFSLPLLLFGSVGVATARSIPTLMIWRFWQAFGASGGVSLGSGVIGDIYKLEERGSAMGIFFAAILLGPALAPLAGGLAAHYASWRVMQLALGVSGLLGFVLVLFYLPETSHPGSRGMDKSTGRRRLVWVNPLSSLSLLKSPNLMALTLAGTVVLLTDYVLLTPIAYTIGARYHITNEAAIGACFLPVGLGNLTGAPIAGRMSDKMVVKWRKRRGGKWVPEDRLRATLSGALILVPLSVLCSGLITRYVEGTTGLGLNLVCFYLNGFGVDLVLSPSAAYGVDILHSRSAEVMAANNGFRAVILAVATAGILPSIDAIGVAATNAIAAALAWTGFGLLWCTIQYGERMRDWVDVGYSTAENN